MYILNNFLLKPAEIHVTFIEMSSDNMYLCHAERKRLPILGKDWHVEVLVVFLPHQTKQVTCVDTDFINPPVTD